MRSSFFFFFFSKERKEQSKNECDWVCSIGSFFSRVSAISISTLPSLSKKRSTQCPENEKNRGKGTILPCRPAQKCPLPHRPKQEAHRRPSPACPCRRPGGSIWNFYLYVRAFVQDSSLLTNVKSGGVASACEEERNRKSFSLFNSLACALKTSSTIATIDVDVVND